MDLEGTAVVVGGVRGRVVAPPFLTRAFPAAETAAAGGAGGGVSAEAAQAAAEEEAAAAVAAAAARAEKLRLMQERLAAWQAQQGQS